MPITLTRNLRLRLTDDLTANARYNLERLDLLATNLDFSSTDDVILRSRSGITIQPNANDLGGTGTGGNVDIGTEAQPVEQFNIYANITCLQGDIAFAEVPKLEGLKLLNDAKLPSTNFIQILAPVGLSTDIQIVLPSTQGAMGTTLINDGTGNLTWAAIATDSLTENHIRIGDASSNAQQVNTTTVGDILADVAGGLIIKPESVNTAQVGSIDADKIDDTTSTNKFVSPSVLADISNNTTNISNIQTAQSAQDAAISANTTANVANAMAISTNTTNISNNDTDISNNAAAIVSLNMAIADSQTSITSENVGTGTEILVTENIDDLRFRSISSDDLDIELDGDNITINLPAPEAIPSSEDGFVRGSTLLAGQSLTTAFQDVNYSTPIVGGTLFDGLEFTADRAGLYYFDALALYGGDEIDFNSGNAAHFLVNGTISRGFNPKTNHFAARHYGLSASTPIILSQGDKVRFQCRQLDNSSSDSPDTVFSGGATNTPITINTSTELPIGHFNVIFLGAADQAESVYVESLTDVIPGPGVGGAERGAPLVLDNVVFDTLGSFSGNIFTPQLGGTYKFGNRLRVNGTGNLTLNDQAVNYRVTRADGSIETYLNNSVTLRGSTNSVYNFTGVHSDTLIDLVVGDSVEILCFLRRDATTVGGSDQFGQVLPGSITYITRVADSSTYVNAYDNRSSSITPLSLHAQEASQEVSDIADIHTNGSITITDPGTYFAIPQVGYTPTGNVDSGAITVLRKNGQIINFKGQGGFLSYNNPRTIHNSGMYEFEAGDVITAETGFENFSTTAGQALNFQPTVISGAETIISGGMQLVKATNNAPPVPVPPPLPQASSIDYNNSTSGLAATNVQDALDELRALIASLHP